MRCTNCDDKIDDSEVRWAFDSPYCETCFDDRFTYCDRCDSVVSRDDASYVNEDETLCSECYNNTHDDDSPVNPDVNDSDREFILRMSRNWLAGKVDYRRFININTKDHYLSEIRTKVGLVDNPINLYGLKEREEYQISVSLDLEETLKENLPESIKYYKIISVAGVRRLGLSLNIRKDYREEVILLINSITVVQAEHKEQPEQLVLL